MESKIWIFEFYTFNQCYKFLVVLYIVNKPYMVIPNLFYYLLQVYIWHFFQIKLFKWCVINVWTIMHIDIHFLKLECFNYDNVKPLKNKGFLGRFEALKIYFSLWITNAFCVCNMLKHALNILWRSHKNEFQKWKVLIILYVYFVQNGTITRNQEKWKPFLTSMKGGSKTIQHNILRF